MKRIRSLFLIFCMIACQTLCFADYKDIQTNHYVDEDGRETSSYVGRKFDDVEIALVLDQRQETPASDLIKYVYTGSGPKVIEFRTKEAKITFRTEMTGSNSTETELVVRLLDENNSVVEYVSRAIGQSHTFSHIDLPPGKYKIEISQEGPGKWEVCAIAPEDASFYSFSRVTTKSVFFKAE